MFQQQLRCPKSLFILEVIRGLLWLAGAQSKTGRQFEIGANARLSHDAFLPTHARTNQKSVFGRHILQDLAELRLQTFGGKARSLI